MILDSYKQFGGIHPETAAYTNVLASHGAVAPHTGHPFTEAMLLGIGGGLGAGYILWEFKKYQSALIVMGFRNRWNYPVKYLQNLSERIGVTTIVQETGSRKKAASNLTKALANNQAVIAWTDQGNMPYFYLPEMHDGLSGHIMAVCGYDDDCVWLDDRATQPIPVPHEAFAKTRGRIGSFKNRLMLLQPTGIDIDLETAILAGIRDCVDYLSSNSTSFSLPALKKWSKMMTDSKNKKGWPTVFKNESGLYGTLQYIYESIRLMGTEGNGLRTVYADFLAESGQTLNNTFMHEAADHYREVANHWQALADAALPLNVPAFAEMRRLLHQKYDHFLAKGTTEASQLQALTQQIYSREAELNANFPLTAAEKEQLYAEIQAKLRTLFEAEKRALATLSAIVA